MKVISVFDLIESGRLIRHQDCTVLTDAGPDDLVLLVSHRWLAGAEPDPTNLQFHQVVRFVIQACMMALGSTPNVFNAVDSSEVILAPGLFDRLGRILRQFDVDSRSMRIDMRGLATNIEQLLSYMKSTVGACNAQLIPAVDYLILAGMMTKIRIWYDYVSLPQAPRSDDEHRVFSRAVAGLPHYFAECDVVVIWSEDGLQRAWCVLEAVCARPERLSIFSSENSLLSSTDPAPLAQLTYRPWSSVTIDFGEGPLERIDLDDMDPELRLRKAVDDEILEVLGRDRPRFDLSADLSQRLSRLVVELREALQGRSEMVIRTYLERHGLQCTVPDDMSLIAAALAQILSSRSTQS